VSSPTGDPNPANNTSPPVTTTVTAVADVAVFKTGPAVGIAGSNLTYTITVTNSGPSTATNVLISDQLPAGLAFVGAAPATATVLNNLVSWPALNLANNTQTNFTVIVVSADGGNFTNVAFATSDTPDPNPANNNGTLTNSQTFTTVTPLADVAVFKTGGTNVAPGGTVNYTITVTNSGPSTASNVVVLDTLPVGAAFQSASGSFTLSNNVVMWSGMTLAEGASVNFNVALTAPASGSIINIASSTSDTPDPNTNNNNGSSSTSQVGTTITPMADVQVFLFGPSNVTVGEGFAYTIVVTNAGPSPAINTLAQDVLPTNLVFASASGNGVFSNGVVTWPIIATLTNGQATNLTVTVTPSAFNSTNILSSTSDPFDFILTNTASIFGFFTNVASAFADTFDPNLTNNDGTLPSAQVQTVIVPGVFSVFIATNTYVTNSPTYNLTNTITPIGGNLFIVGTSAFNPETQLYEETVSVTNVGTAVVNALRLYVGGLRSGVTLYNATGTNNIGPYVEYDLPLPPGDNVTFFLEFFVADRHPFTNSLTAVAVVAPPPPTVPAGTPVFILQGSFDPRYPNNARFIIEFSSIPGRTYTILYSDDLVTWNVAVPSVVANANYTFWYDDGPPSTVSSPTNTPHRFYRVILSN
jgi:uncharacterized repeat protein (TIGR01451 family)